MTESPTDTRFSEIFYEVHPSLCRFLEQLLGSPDIAHEIAQETFLRLYQTGAKVVKRDEARFWLFRVARNLALNEIDRIKTRRRLRDQVARLFARRPRTPEEETESAEQVGLVPAMLEHLTQNQRSALLLRELEDMSYSEIASVLDITESKVKVDIYRARMRLRETWAVISSKGSIDAEARGKS